MCRISEHHQRKVRDNGVLVQRRLIIHSFFMSPQDPPAHERFAGFDRPEP